MSSEFWVGITQTAIGSGLGFILGICAFHYQQRQQFAKAERDNRRANVEALNRLRISAGANVEALANSKLQFIYELRPEIDKMKVAAAEYFDAVEPERMKKMSTIVEISRYLRNFYMSFPKTSIMQPPEVSEYSAFSKEMPALPLFVHRAIAMMSEINERIDSRNSLIAEYARENGASAGMTGERVFYYSSMLADEGLAICEHTDFALDFWRLVIDQIEAFMTVKERDDNFLEFKLVPEATKAMPDEELFPLMRDQLRTF
jgi:hypothetical protein